MAGQSGRWTDQEIKSLGGDRLKFGTYSRVLAQVILEANAPLTIGVFGPWGCGKSSLMHLMEESLHEESPAQGKKVLTVWFNAWRYDREEALWRALILRVLAVLGENLLGVRNAQKPLDDLPKSKQKLAQELEDLQASLYHEVEREEIGGVTVDWEKMGKGAAGWVTRLSLGLIPGLGGPLSKLAEEAQKRLSGDDLDTLFSAVQRHRQKERRDHIRSLEQFRGNLERLVEKHVRKRRHLLVIFIDDLDRCLPEKAIEVLEAIKLFLDVPGCVFVIGADRDVIEEGIRVKYESFLRGLGGDLTTEQFQEHMPITGDDYLEKIVQLPFHIPPLREGLVEEFIREQEADLPEGCAGLFCLGVERNPRKVKRAINMFRLLRLLADERAAAGEMELAEPQLLAKIVVILVRWRELFEDLDEYPNLLPELEKVWVEGGPPPLRLGSPGPQEPSPDLAKGPADAAAINETSLLLGKYWRIRPLGRMLAQGPAWFAGLPLEQLREYIYLARSTTGVEELTEADIQERRWADLLSNDSTKIRAAFARMSPDERQAQAGRLITFMGSDRPPIYRLPAGNALAILGDPRPGVDPQVSSVELMECCYVPSGMFYMGSEDDDDIAPDDEKPLHAVEIPYDYWIARYPVTVAQLRAFVEAGHKLEHVDILAGVANHPAVWVNWHEGLEFCEWLTSVLRGWLPDGYVVALPTEAEWEKAARGGVQIPVRRHIGTVSGGLALPGEIPLVDNPVPNRRFPWGQEAEASRGNYSETYLGGPTTVGGFMAWASPYGADDMSGNVWEWTASVHKPYPYDRADGREDTRSGGRRAVRGGSFADDHTFARCASRSWSNPRTRTNIVGFRVVVSTRLPG